MSTTLLKTIQRIALETIEASRPVKVLFGKVVSEAPLEIELIQGHKRLSSEFLVLCRNVTDHTVEMEVNHQVEKMSGGAKDPSFQSHIHQYKGVKPFKVLNALKVGEKVIMIQMQGGQQYIVLDRIG